MSKMFERLSPNVMCIYKFVQRLRKRVPSLLTRALNLTDPLCPEKSKGENHGHRQIQREQLFWRTKDRLDTNFCFYVSFFLSVKLVLKLMDKQAVVKCKISTFQPIHSIVLNSFCTELHTIVLKERMFILYKNLARYLGRGELKYYYYWNTFPPCK